MADYNQQGQSHESQDLAADDSWMDDAPDLSVEELFELTECINKAFEEGRQKAEETRDRRYVWSYGVKKLQWQNLFEDTIYEGHRLLQILWNGPSEYATFCEADWSTLLMQISTFLDDKKAILCSGDWHLKLDWTDVVDESLDLTLGPETQCPTCRTWGHCNCQNPR